MKYLLALILGLLVSTGIVYACAEGEVWQPEITYQNGQCTEYKQVHTGHKLGIKTEFVCWLTGNDWFKGKCYHGGSVINQCVAYEQIENVGGQCVPTEDEGDDTSGDDEQEEETGGEGEEQSNTGGSDEANKSNSYGTSLWTRLSNVSGIKYTRDNISLQDGLALYDQIMAERIAKWEAIKEQRKAEKQAERELRKANRNN